MAEALRLLARATDAFVDGVPIDWSALLARIGTPADRALVESLRDLEAVRDARRSKDRPAARAPQFRLGAMLVIAAGCLLTAASIFTFGLSWAHGEPAHRIPQLVLAAAFLFASLPLAIVST